jgi:plasmid maintenance system antidote protein VapI
MRKESYIETTLLRELEKSGQKPAEIAKLTGIERSVLSRFMSGERGLSVWAAAQLLRHFGYRITKGKL